MSGVSVILPNDQAVIVTYNDGVPGIQIDAVAVMGPPGPAGNFTNEGPFYLTAQPLNSVAGVLTIDLSECNTFVVNLTESITSVVFQNWPTGPATQRIALYFHQSVGGHTVTGFPAGTKWAFRTRYEASLSPDSWDLVFVDSFDGGATLFAAVVGLDYGTP